MEQLEKFPDEELNLLIKEIIGKNWQLSLLTEIITQKVSYPCYQEWDFHIDEIKDSIETDHMHQRFTLYYFLLNTLEMQLITVLNSMKDRIELKRSLMNRNFYEVA